ncbi:hypothetical protein DPEC_G00089550 [Dallia pectoralis]|nr:hypothetical protein DPEC_G00089550 [Dallia pectoralis]
MWAPVEAPSLLSDPSSSEIDIGPLDLWGESPETGDPVVGSLPGLFVLPPPSVVSLSSSKPFCHPAGPSMIDAGTQHEVSGQVARSVSNSNPVRQPRRVRRAPDMFGDWIGY